MFRLNAPSHGNWLFVLLSSLYTRQSAVCFKSGWYYQLSFAVQLNEQLTPIAPFTTGLCKVVFTYLRKDGSLIEPYRYPTTPDDPEHDVIPSGDSKEGFSLISKRSLHYPPTYYRAKCFLHTSSALPFQKLDLPPPPASNGMATPR